MTQEYDTYLFRMRAYTVGREAVTDWDPVMRPLDILHVSVILKENHNIIDKENPVEQNI